MSENQITNPILNARVAGVSFDGRQELIAQLTGREPCRLEPEPENKFDPNAIAVKVSRQINAEQESGPGSDRVIWHIGYLPKEIAAQVAPHLDGEPLMCKIAEITGGFLLANGNTAPLGVRLEIELPGMDTTVL